MTEARSLKYGRAKRRGGVQKKTAGMVRLEYQGVKLNLTKEVKYIGVILDDKLKWKAHVRAQVKKGLKALWSCNAYIGRTWVLSLKMALWLYKCVIILKITYAAVAWWDGMHIALTRSKLVRLQRAACIMITGAMRTTPTKVLKMFLDLPTLVCSTDGSILSTETKSKKPRGIGHNRIWAKANKMDS